FGRAITKDDAPLSRVTVATSAAEVQAEFDSSGNWRVNDLPVPESGNSFSINVRIEDSNERIVVERLQLTKVINASVGGGVAWEGSSRAIVYDGSKTVWVLLTGTRTNETKIIPINTDTGHRGASILSAPLAAT